MAKGYMVVRIDNMAADTTGSLIKSVKYYDSSDAPAEVQNGVFVNVGDLLDGEREVHKAVDATSTDENVGIICNPEVIYDQNGLGDSDLGNYINEADEPIRVKLIHEGDIFSIANETDGGADKVYGSLTAEFQGTEKSGRYTYNVYEVKKTA